MLQSKYFRIGKLQKGFSLIEVLISGAIMSSGLAALAALLFTSVSGTAQTGHQTSASLLADSVASMIGISPHALPVFLQSPPAVVINCDQFNPCSAEQFAQYGWKSWQLDTAVQLPSGSGIVCADSSPFDGSSQQADCDGGDLLVVKVFWQPAPGREPSSARLSRIIR